MRVLRHWPLAVGALLPLVAVVELFGNWWTARIVPPPAAFAGPRKVVAAEHREGDLVIVAPEWLGEGRVALGPWMPLRDQARGDILDYPRVWELTLEGRRSPETAGLPVEKAWSFDRLSLTRYRNPTYRPALWRAFDDPASAKVHIAAQEGDIPCRWEEREQQHRCGDSFGQPWVYVAPFVVTDMNQQAHFCLWAHPTLKGPIVATWENVPAGKTLVVHTAMSYIAARDMDKLPVLMDTVLDGTTLGTAVQPDGAGWRTWTYAVPPGAERRQVQFRVMTGFQGMRHFCFDATMRGQP
jgi:hypothetical protein